MLHMQPDRPSPQPLRRPTAAACLAMAAFLAAAGHAQAGVVNLNFDESKSGNYSAEAKLKSTDTVQGVVAADISFNNVAIGATTPEQKNQTLGAFYSVAEIAGKVTRNFDGKYLVATELAGAVSSSNLQTWPKNTVPPTNHLSISATYTDTFWITDTGDGPKVLGITFMTESPLILYPDRGDPNSVSLSLVFSTPTAPHRHITIDSVFAQHAQQINIEFDQFGPDELYTMEMNFELKSTIIPAGSQAQPDQNLGVNVPPRSTVKSYPLAFFVISDEIPGAPVKQFSALNEPGPPTIVPGPAAAPAGLLLLGGMALFRQRRSVSKVNRTKQTHCT